MLDPKTFDIPNTGANCMQQLKDSGMGIITDLYTLHATGGAKMMRSMANKRDQLELPTRLLAISVLTTMTDAECRQIYGKPVRQMILQLATVAKQNGIDGIVCAPKEARMLREYFEEDFLIVTPNIRLDDGSVVANDDQNPNRARTPKEAMGEGVSRMVVGRPITQSQNPQVVIDTILKDIAEPPIFVHSGRDYRLERAIYDGTVEDILKASGNIYRRAPDGPYVRLASKLLSDGYINIGGAVEADPRILERLTRDQADNLEKAEIKFDVVVGAAMGSVRLSDNLARMTGTDKALYTEKVGKAEDGTDIHAFKRHKTDLVGKHVVISEDVITKAQTTRQLIKLVQDAGGIVVGVSCVANRTGSDNIDGIPLLGLWTPPQFGMWHDATTPADKHGDTPVLPEEAKIENEPKANWDTLVKTM